MAHGTRKRHTCDNNNCYLISTKISRCPGSRCAWHRGKQQGKSTCAHKINQHASIFMVHSSPFEHHSQLGVRIVRAVASQGSDAVIDATCVADRSTRVRTVITRAVGGNVPLATSANSIAKTANEEDASVVLSFVDGARAFALAASA